MPDSSANALLGFVGWTAAHTAIIIGARVIKVILKQRRANQFGKSRDGDEVSFIGRVGKSHANCVENLVLFAAVILTNKAFARVDLGDFPTWFLYARVAQSLVHWIGVSELQVNVRFAFFITQAALLAAMGGKVHAALK